MALTLEQQAAADKAANDKIAADKAAKQLNVYLVTYVVRNSPGTISTPKTSYVVAHDDFAAGAWVTKNAVLHPKQVSKDAQGKEQVLWPAQSSIEVLGIRTLQQDVEVATGVAPTPPPPAPAPMPATAVQ